MDYLKKFEAALEAPGDFPACYAFSIHKSGSTLMHRMIGEVCDATRTPAINIPTELFKEGLADRHWQADPRVLDMIGPGRIYYGFRQLPQILRSPRVALRDKLSVLLVRDPRDALVSQYYSFGGRFVSHRLPEKNQQGFLDSVESTKDLSIDEYVVESAPIHLAKLDAYLEALDFRRVLLRRYEQIYFDKEKFLGEIFSHFGIDVPAEIIARVAARHDIRPLDENPSNHIRKGVPGDHRNKLMPATIVELNNIFRDTCRRYGYELGATPQ